MMMRFERRDQGLCLVVAHASHRVIGHKGSMPWHLPEDLKHFRAFTLDASVLMGRQTFEAIGKPLPRRRNIVISRQNDWHPQGAIRAASFEEALHRAGPEEVYVIGGGQIYQLALPHADRAVVTEIDLDVTGDTYFPELGATSWRALHHIKAISSQGLAYSFTDYRRINP